MGRSRKKKEKKADTVTRLGPRSRPGPSPSRVRDRVRAVLPDRGVKARTERLRLAPNQLACRYKGGDLPFKTTREVTALRGIFGQRRALGTLAMGLRMQGLGYNLFVCGYSGSESTAQLIEFVRSLKLPIRDVPDRCYVQNFENPNRPLLLELPSGQGVRLRDAIHGVLARLHRKLTKQEERRWKSLAKDILTEEVGELLQRFPQEKVAKWLQQWRRNLQAAIHHAIVEDYEVNLLSTNGSKRAPVVHETLPTQGHLFGWIGRRALADQAPAPHFTEISGGALLAADGGVLILQASDFRASSTVWATLKSCMKYGSLQIEDGDGGAMSRASGLKPEPIDLNVKVVLIGDYGLFDHLFETEQDFRDVFKIRVDFDHEVPVNQRVLRREYPSFIGSLCEKNRIRPLTAGAVARVMEYGVRKAGRRNKITAQAPVISDLLREADYWAASEGRRLITERDVQRAVEEGILRLNLVETKISEMISEGTILISTRGSRVGQVNGLAIYDMGDYLFAKPSRITAETSVGQGGIINIEREAGFSGRSHDKGVHILAGYLRSRFAQDRPLSLTSSVCFEQSYSGVDGDSASATEIYAILSSLSGLPIRQDIAVTGSLNQKGDMQPIGGVNEKIEGFYDCISSGRRTGREGVIIPRKNVNELVLRDDVVRSVARRKFHIYAIDTIEQGIEILTGVSVGRSRKRGGFTPGSVFDRVDQRLDEIAQGLRRFHDDD